MARIKSRTVYSVNLVMDDHQSEYLEEDRYISSYMEFDSKGKPVIEEQREASGALVERYIRSYSSVGKLLQEEYETGEEGPVSAKVFVYDTDGKLIEEKGTYVHGGAETIVYQHDDNDTLLSILCLDDEQEEEFKETFRYVDGQVVEESRWEYGQEVLRKAYAYSKARLVESIIEHHLNEGSKREKRFEHDEEGRMVVESDYINGKILTRKTYEYDDQGRVSAIKEEEAFRRDQVVFHYDKSGNNVLQEEMDTEGNLLQQVKRTYDEHGQILSTEVFSDGSRAGISRRYALQFEYTYYPEDEE